MDGMLLRPMQYIVLSPDGTYEVRQGKPDLKALYAAIGCDMVQVIDLDGATMWLDEEAKTKDTRPPVNPIATTLGWSAGTHPLDFILGKVVLTGEPDDDDGEAQTVPPYWTIRLNEMGARRAA